VASWLAWGTGQCLATYRRKRRRAVTVEHLSYNADGAIEPFRQTGAGVSLPPPAQSTSHSRKSEPECK
jgi:hypothetical protein